MSGNTIYEAIAKRTGGNVYIGVVGPVRSGKSTFISRFTETAILPAITDEYERERTRDEMPQSGSGRAVMTTEPKFVPREAVTLNIADTELSVRLIDCVGFMVDGAEGTTDAEGVRMVKTPWSEEPIPFTEAAEIGTQRVVREHSTVAVMVTTDGSFTGIDRAAYEVAEERTVAELKAAGVPFAVILNSKEPDSPEAIALAEMIEEKHGAPVALVDATRLTEGDINAILAMLTDRFPLRELTFRLPDWYSLLPDDHPIITGVLDEVSSFAEDAKCFGDVARLVKEYGCFGAYVQDAGVGEAVIEIPFDKGLYMQTLSDAAGIELSSDAELYKTVTELCAVKREYDKLRDALRDVKECGWGVVMPCEGDLEISEPQLVRAGSQWGVRVGASAEAIHLVRTSIRTDVSPAVGTEEQAAEVAKQLAADYGNDPASLLDSKLFGKSMSDLVSEGIAAKLSHMPPEARQRMGGTIERIINEGASGLICILV